jgi:hypothetical protein
MKYRLLLPLVLAALLIGLAACDTGEPSTTDQHRGRRGAVQHGHGDNGTHRDRHGHKRAYRGAADQAGNG